MRQILLLASLFLASCTAPNSKESTGKDSVPDSSAGDLDGDGFIGEDDCDESDAAIHVGATESCNGIDENCDGNEDQDLTTTYYRDADADGWGSDDSTDACSAPTGYVEHTGDCDDNDALYHPGADE
ncbi:MAG TPA: putative metal-binding motif-containing protein, partial [Myxococcota bacterium]|nr:putative metal-binding motif-containing protein [Myxococcota bacterium]